MAVFAGVGFRRVQRSDTWTPLREKGGCRLSTAASILSESTRCSRCWRAEAGSASGGLDTIRSFSSPQLASCTRKDAATKSGAAAAGGGGGGGMGSGATTGGGRGAAAAALIWSESARWTGGGGAEPMLDASMVGNVGNLPPVRALSMRLMEGADETRGMSFLLGGATRLRACGWALARQPL